MWNGAVQSCWVAVRGELPDRKRGFEDGPLAGRWLSALCRINENKCKTQDSLSRKTAGGSRRGASLCLAGE